MKWSTSGFQLMVGMMQWITMRRSCNVAWTSKDILAPILRSPLIMQQGPCSVACKGISTIGYLPISQFLMDVFNVGPACALNYGCVWVPCEVALADRDGGDA